MNKFQLTNEGINKIVNSEKIKKIDGNYNLQVIAIREVNDKKKAEGPNQKTTWVLTLADEANSTRFFYVTSKDCPKKFDIINIKCFNINLIGGKQHFPLIHDENCSILGNPGKNLFEGQAQIQVNPDTNQNIQNVPNNGQEIRSSGHNQQIPRDSTVPQGFALEAINTFSRDYTIVVRVTKKGELKKYNNAKGPGQLISCLIIDSNSTEMELMAFGKQADELAEKLSEGKVYKIFGTYAKMASKKFSTVKSDFALYCSEQLSITEVSDSSRIAKFHLNPTKIPNIKSLPPDTNIDVIGKLIKIGEKTTINTKNGAQLDMKKILLVDEGKIEVEVTLWSELTSQELILNEIYGFKSVKVHEYGGSKSLSCGFNSIVVFRPDFPETKEIEDFFKNQDGSIVYESLRGEGENDKPLSFMIKAVDSFSRINDDTKSYTFRLRVVANKIFHSEKNYYLACVNCKKKLQDENSLHCLACDKLNPEATYSYKFSIQVKDSTDEYYVEFLGKLGEKIFGITCNEYKNLITNKDDIRLMEITSNITFKTMDLTVRATQKIFNNENRRQLMASRVSFPENDKSISELQNLISNFFEMKKI